MGVVSAHLGGQWGDRIRVSSCLDAGTEVAGGAPGFQVGSRQGGPQTDVRGGGGAWEQRPGALGARRGASPCAGH